MENEEQIDKLKNENARLLEKLKAYEIRYGKITNKIHNPDALNFEDLFKLEDIQRIQNQFASTLDVGSIITHTDGTPITQPSNFCHLCNDIIRGTKLGRTNCYKSDSILGQFSTEGPTIQKCISGGLWDAGAAIVVDGKHIANWLIGQVRDESMTEEKIRSYAREIGADEEEAAKALQSIPLKTENEFRKIADLLYIMAEQLSEIAYRNYQKSVYIKKDQIIKNELAKSEAYLRTIIDTIPDFFWIKDLEGKYLYSNPRLESLLGIPRDTIIGKTDYDFFSPETADMNRLNEKKVLEEKTTIKEEEIFNFANDGHRETNEVIKTPVFREDGEILGVLGIGRNITEFKKAEKERLENIQFFQMLDKLHTIIYRHIELNDQLYYILDLMLELFNGAHSFFLFPCDSNRTEWEIPAVCTKQDYKGMFQDGISKEAIPAISLIMKELESNYINIEHYDHNVPREFKSLWETYSVSSQLFAAIYPGIGVPWVLGIQRTGKASLWTDREKKMFTEINRRITDLLTSQLMNRNIRKNEKFLDNIFENIPLMAYVKDAQNLNFIRFNKAGEKITGYPQNDFIGKNDYSFFPKKDADYFTTNDRKVLSEKRLEDIPNEKIHNANGQEILLHTRKIPIMDDNDNPLYILSLSEDITDRVKTADELEITKRWLESFLDSTTEGISIYDTDLNLVVCSRKALSYFPEDIIEEGVIGKNYYELIKHHPNSENANTIVQEVLNTGEPYENETSIIVNNQEKWAYLRIFKIDEGLGIITTDISERKRLEKQLLQNQKIQSIGRLAGGVAHDYNNMLGIILGQAELALRNKEVDEKTKNHLSEIIKAAERSAQLTRQLLAFARKQTIKPEIVDINHTIEKMLKMLKSLIGENIGIEWLPAEEPCLVEMDPGQIDQVIINLCVNARDAIEKTGRITLKTENIKLNESYCYFHPESTTGDYIVLSIIDNGKGMDKKTQSMIFEPFFTTKKTGEGTGLGLATVYGIIRQNGGFINVYSEMDYGTTMKVFFPRNISRKKELNKKHNGAAEGGNETIFVIEDDASVLQLTTMMLTSLGYTVISANSAEEAMKTAEETELTIDLILCDVVMPEMNGSVLMEKMLKTNPEIKYMFMSGYTYDIITKHDVMEKGINFIEKPFSRINLAKKIREILDN